MRFVTYDEGQGRLRAGVLDGETVHPLGEGTTVLSLLGDDGTRLRRAGEDALTSTVGTREVSDVIVCAPIPTPPSVRDFMTFESHVEGSMKLVNPDNPVPAEWYDAPAFYFSNPYATIGPDEDVMVPPGSTMFDLELEVAVVIGKPGRDITVEDAWGHVAGYSILIDWSARDLQMREMGVRLGPSKGKDSATTLGPTLVTPDELEPFRSGKGFDLHMSARVNDVEIGSDTLASMGYSFAEMISHASRGTEVRPGDVLGSGTCGGGCLAELWGRHGVDAHSPLTPGDTVTVAVEQLGVVSQRIVQYGTA
jgi:2-keto-4-pentenoate hydratase/2-oxohepta-3-ene-1,7-dioic acid hydratase in catechol pathway